MAYIKHDGLEHKGRDAQERDVWRLRGRVGGVSFDERFHGTKTAARKHMTALRNAAAEGTLAESSDQSVDHLVDSYITHRVSIGKVRPGKPEDTYRRYARLHVSPVIGSMRVADVRAGHAQQVIDRMVSAGKASSTVRQVYAIAHGAFRWAVKQRRMVLNPFDAAELPEQKRQQLAAVQAEDVAAILRKVEEREPEYLLPIRLLTGTGMRRGEACALRWRDLRLDGEHEACSMHGVAHAHVEGTTQRIGAELRAMPPKSASGRRAVPLAPSIVELLREHRKAQNEARLALGEAWTDHDLIVEAGSGTPLDPTRLSDAFRRAARRAGVSIRLHDLRHAWATRMISAGQSAAAVGRALGHSQISFTLTTYVHPDAEMGAPLAAAAEDALGNLLG
jgi:integrase